MNTASDTESIQSEALPGPGNDRLAAYEEDGAEDLDSARPNPWLTALQIIGILAIVVGAFWLGTQRELVQRFSQWGYLSSFLISLIGSATVILPAPGLALILALGAHLNPVLLGIVAGVGSGLGELSGYLAGKAGRNLVSKEGRFNAFLHHMTTRFTTPALFILAILPLPIFDFAGILAGALRMPVLRFLGVVISGKIIKHALAAYLGAEFFEMVLNRFSF
ncbi:MAG: VTT domain-containing protein [Caldilineaceae bacterium]|nr:VTT domain-containing protein [Caldilineaceae bacterium]MDE0337303.1 VTT domain-containing protein [Caldilineaceae bacterium]